MMARSGKKTTKAVKTTKSTASKNKTAAKKTTFQKILTAEGWKRLMMKKFRKTKKS
jgi:hypothetical protein